VGPLSFAQLQALAAAGTLARTDMVLRDGTRQWIAAATVPGLFVEPPPLPASAPLAPCSSSRERLTGESLSKHRTLAEAQVVPESGRCVQCGCCSYNCPMGIDVRSHARRGQPIHDSHCLTCGECVKRCPRGVLTFEPIPLLRRE
jgi:ferredoxin